MDASIVDKDLIERINKGEEKAFEVLYNSYFVYLCACANSYIFNPVEAQDIVNETFAKIWYRRGELSFPIHAYLIRAIQNGCLNYLRSLHSRERIIGRFYKFNLSLANSQNLIKATANVILLSQI